MFTGADWKNDTTSTYGKVNSKIWFASKMQNQMIQALWLGMGENTFPDHALKFYGVFYDFYIHLSSIHRENENKKNK